MRCIGQVEIDPYCLAVLERHWPDVPRWKDVRKFCRRIYDCEPENEDGEVICQRCNTEFGECECVGTDQFMDEHGFPELICGGFPCQPVSVAGRNLQDKDPRWLWPEFARIIDQIRPAWVLAENVLGLRTRGYDGVAGDLEGLGYTVRAIVVGAEHVGAPHRRHRVWIVADTAGITESKSRHADETVRAGRDARRVAGGNGTSDTRGDGNRGLADSDRERIGDADESRGLGGSDRSIAIDARGIGETRWPARPGELQHKWEEPRLAQFPLGGAIDGLSVRLVRFANREALRAYGNSVVPQVAEVIGRAIMAAVQ